MNRRKTVTLLLSILLHLIPFTLLWIFLSDEKTLLSTGSKRVELSLQDFVTPSSAKPAQKKSASVSAPKSMVQPKPVRKQVAKPKTEPRHSKPDMKKAQKEKAPKKTQSQITKKETPKPRKKNKQPVPQKSLKTEPKREKELKKEESLQKEKKESSPLSKLAGSLGAPSMPLSRPQSPSVTDVANALSEREFKALYKDDFDHFTPNQKSFIKNNLSRIQEITQHYLTQRGYPYVAARLGIDGMNIVEFDLHPNGDITGLKIIKEAGFEELDKNSIDTIKTAYKDYPRPDETTKIRFYIHYRLY